MQSSCQRGPIWWMLSLVALTVVTIGTISARDGQDSHPAEDMGGSPEVQFAQELDLEAEMRRMDTMDRISKEADQEEQLVQTPAINSKAKKQSASARLMALSAGALSPKAPAAPPSKDAVVPESSPKATDKAQPDYVKLMAAKLVAKQGLAPPKEKPAEKKKKPATPSLDLSQVTHSVLTSVIAMAGSDDDDDDGAGQDTPNFDNVDAVEEDDDFTAGIELMNQHVVKTRTSFSHLVQNKASDKDYQELKEEAEGDLTDFFEVGKRKKAKAPKKADPKPAVKKPAAPKMHMLATSFFEKQGPLPHVAEPPTPKKVHTVKVAAKKAAEKPAAAVSSKDCRPPFCLPSGIETARRKIKAKKKAKNHSQHKKVLKKHGKAIEATAHFLTSIIPSSIDEFDEQQGFNTAEQEQEQEQEKKLKADSEEEAARQAIARAAMEKTLHGEKKQAAHPKKAAKRVHKAKKEEHAKSAKKVMESALKAAANDADLAAVEDDEIQHGIDKKGLMADLLRQDLSDDDGVLDDPSSRAMREERREMERAAAKRVQHRGALLMGKGKHKVDYAKIMAGRMVKSQAKKVAARKAAAAAQQHKKDIRKVKAAMVAASAEARTSATQKALQALHQPH